MNNQSKEQMENMKDIIIKLKKIRDDRKLTNGQIERMLHEDGYDLSKTSISRVFADGSEDVGFNYEYTIRPIANALLNMEEIEEDDSPEIQAMKSLLKYKIECMEELERIIEQKDLELAEINEKHHNRIDSIRAEQDKRTEFLMNQINLKDKRIDALLNAVNVKDSQLKDTLDHILECPYRKDCHVKS